MSIGIFTVICNGIETNFKTGFKYSLICFNGSCYHNCYCFCECSDDTIYIKSILDKKTIGSILIDNINYVSFSLYDNL